MIPFNFGNSMTGTLLEAVQRVKGAGAVAEDELNRQFRSNKEWLQKENEMIDSIIINSSINKNPNEKIANKHKKIINEELKEPCLDIAGQSNNENDKFITISANNFYTDQNLKINFENSITHINQRPHPAPLAKSKTNLNYSDLVRNSTDFLRNIISSLQAEDDPYEMSDWEDDEAMKPMELDIDADIINGKKIPAWACGKQLAIAVAKQNQIDGERIFQDLDRRVDIVKLFGTNVFPYYQQRIRC